MHMVFSGSELLPSHVLNMCSCWKWMYFFSFLIFYQNSTCCLMHMVSSGGELLPSHVLSTCCCWKWMYFFSFRSNLLPKFHLFSYAHGILRRWVVTFPFTKYMYLLKVSIVVLHSNLLSNFNLLSYAHGILRKWVVTFPCIKYDIV